MCKCMIVKASNGHQQEYKILIVPLCSLWFSTFAALGVLLVTKILKDERHISIKAYKIVVFEI